MPLWRGFCAAVEISERYTLLDADISRLQDFGLRFGRRDLHSSKKSFDSEDIFLFSTQNRMSSELSDPRYRQSLWRVGLSRCEGFGTGAIVAQVARLSPGNT